jgi:hypothetical protein
MTTAMKKLLCVFILYFPLAFSVIAQENHVDTVVKKFKVYRENNLQEKMYGHLDRSFYLTGETLWFKIYTVDGSFHKPLHLSKVAYAEVLDSAGFPVLQGKIALKNGLGAGSFFLPASLSSGKYHFRLYSRWMKNFSPEFFFSRAITIVNPFVEGEASIAKKAGGYSVDFFPEGGNLVNGIESKVAFKITDHAGRGVSAHGTILTEDGDSLASFSALRFGMGHFSFTPSDNGPYTVVLSSATGAKRVHSFPEIQRSGYVMALKDSGEFLRITIRSKDVPDKAVFLFTHARHIISFAERRILQNSSAFFTLRKDQLPEGICHLTLFNEQLNPVAERLYFTYPRKELHISIQTNQKVYRPREKVSMTLQTRKGSESKTPANLSVSVYKIDSLSSEKATNGIYPYFWLAADLTGEIESPSYYFDEASADKAEAMDHLMLTHGWRRFNWRNVLAEEYELPFIPEVNGHLITGVIGERKEHDRGIFAYMGSPGKIVRPYGAWSNAAGEVLFDVKNFYGPRQLILQVKADSAKRFSLKIDNPFSTLNSSQNFPELVWNKKRKDALVSRSIAMQVQDIFYYERYGNRLVQPAIDSSAFYGKADATYHLDDYTRFPVMEEVMREYVPGVFVRKRKDGFHFVVIDKVHGGVFNGDPMVLLDGVPVLDVDNIMKIDPLRVKKLEVIKRQWYLGDAVFPGIVSYTTYNGDLGGIELDPNSISLNYEGLQLQREFYSPRYNTEKQDERLPDQRYLLYWNPNLNTDEEGAEEVAFFTSDVEGAYQIVIEGMNEEGFCGTRTYHFSVKPRGNQ